MRFCYAESMTDPSFYAPLARAAEEAGFASMMVPDSICYPRALRQPVPVQSRRQPRVPGGQAVPRAVLAHPGPGRRHQPAEVHHLRAQAPRPPPGAGRQAGHLDRRAHRQPARPGRRDQPLARGLRGARGGLGHPRPAPGRGDRHPARPRGRGLLRASREDLRPAAGQDRPGARPRRSRSSSAATPTRPCAAPPGWATAGCTAGETWPNSPRSWPAWPSTAAPPAPTTARSRST